MTKIQCQKSSNVQGPSGYTSPTSWRLGGDGVDPWIMAEWLHESWVSEKWGLAPIVIVDIYTPSEG